MNAIDYAGAFIDRLGPATDQSRALAKAVGVWRKYRLFLQTLFDEYRTLTGELSAVVAAIASGQLDAAGAFQRLGALHMLVGLKIESAYLFLKILLDRTSETFYSYYALKRPKRLGSTHRTLLDEFPDICARNRLTDPRGELHGLMKNLGVRIVHYRNVAIEHVPTLHANQLVMSSIAEDGGREVQIAGAGAPSASEALVVLLIDLDAYMVRLIDFFEANRGAKQP